jgi:hypothetical protein
MQSKGSATSFAREVWGGRRPVLIALLAMWLLAVIVGLGRLGVYANAAGPAGTPPPVWPPDSRVARPARGATLLLFAHPHCPCSRASISELARLMTKGHGRVTATVMMYRPSNQPVAWAQSHLWNGAAAIPGVRVLTDLDGRESAIFRANVSGHTLLYDAGGRLVFSGGITGARGHEGDNAGRHAIERLLLDGTATIDRSSVFGCFLRSAV